MTDLTSIVSDALARSIALHIERDVLASDLSPKERMALADDVIEAVLMHLREPTPAMVDAFVSRALQVSISGEGGWSAYAVGQWRTMVDAAIREIGR